MKVVLLGAGGMGGYAARTAAGFDFVDELLVADRDEAAARRLSDSLGDKARAVALDVTDPHALDRVLTGATAALNTVGPFFRFGPPVLEAAIRSGCHYLDINDDWESTEAMLALDERARAAGITAVIGMGASPGISNLLTRIAMRELDTVHEVYPGFDLDAAMPETRGSRPSAATVHGIHQLTGTIRVFDRGRFRDEPPLRRIDLDYPGLGPRRAWTMGHPEAITFPRYFPELRRSLIVMTMARPNLLAMRALGKLVDARLLSLERAAGLVERLEGVGGRVKTPEDYLREMLDEPRLPPLFSVVRGTKDGRVETVAATLLSAPRRGMGGATGVPLGLGLAVLRPEREQKRGVFAPEAIVDPDAFFNQLAPLCTPVMADRDALLLVSRSWERVELRAELERRLGA
ncbi:MAG: saccharopine dehydrogenase NADP-binding domain-containing protein [Polyangiaceae bacterium]|nr:saccharopine dehydrogenase NADP-binding domain-containing protein [Polyangiaceae bacterium]